MNDTHEDVAIAREWSARHAEMLRTERAAVAELLLSLAEFERRLLHRELGYASLFDYLHRELRLSRGMSHYRVVAARLVGRFPEVVEPLRDGRLCISTVVELARVLDEGNGIEVLPRFLGLSREEAKQVAAELAPREMVPRRTVVTVAPGLVPLAPESVRQSPVASVAGGQSSTVELSSGAAKGAGTVSSSTVVLATRGTLTSPGTKTVVEPLTARETRIHLTVSPEFLELLRRARAGEAHSRPGATDEEVLTAALDLLLARQERRKSSVPAKVKREVRRRDGNRCQWPTHDGGVCGATVRTEIDHVVPRGRGGPSTAENCRVLCKAHNLEAARRAYGDDHMDRFAPRTPPTLRKQTRAAPPQPGLPLAREPAAPWADDAGARGRENPVDSRPSPPARGPGPGPAPRPPRPGVLLDSKGPVGYEHPTFSPPGSRETKVGR